jgi:hypothetical protein
MISPKNKRGLVLEGMNNSPGKPFLHVKRSSIPPSAMVTLPPPAKKGPPSLYPIHRYYTHSTSEKTQDSRIQFGDGAAYKVLPELPYAAISFSASLTPNMYYVSPSTTNGAFPFTFDELVAVEKQRLETIRPVRILNERLKLNDLKFDGTYTNR